MRFPFSGYNDDDQHASNLMRICEPGIGDKVLWMRGISVTNENEADQTIKLYDEAEDATPGTATAAKQRLTITAKANATTVVDYPAPGVKFVDDVGATSHADIKAYDVTVTGYLE